MFRIDMKERMKAAFGERKKYCGTRAKDESFCNFFELHNSVMPFSPNFLTVSLFYRDVPFSSYTLVLGGLECHGS